MKLPKLALLFLALATPLAANANGLPAPVTAALKAQGVPTDGLSIYVHEVGASQPLLAFAADIPRNPASTLKLLTTLAALDTLGPAYTWKTEAWSSAPIKDGVLQGDLILKGYGDPFLVNEYLWTFLQGLRGKGINHVAGDLIIDNSYFARNTIDPSAFDGKPHRVYNAMPAALVVNFSASRLDINPTNGKVELSIEPVQDDIVIDNRMRLVKGKCQWKHKRPAISVGRNGDKRVVSVSGNYSKSCGQASINRTLSEPGRVVHGAFKALWQESGGQFAGGLGYSQIPSNAKLIHAQSSRSLAEQIRGMNKYSNNLMARQILLTLAAEKYGAPGSIENGRAAVNEWLASQGLHFPELVLDNGAGLSRISRITAANMGRMLLHAFNTRYMPEYLASLSVTGVDGTMRRRLRGAGMTGRAHLKTGTLDDVRSNAGYVLARNGKRYVVVILHNYPGIHRGKGSRVQDAVIRWVFER